MKNKQTATQQLNSMIINLRKKLIPEVDVQASVRIFWAADAEKRARMLVKSL